MKTQKYTLLKIVATLLFLLATMLFITSQWMGEVFGPVSFEQILFHIMAPAEGANKHLVWEYLLSVSLGLLATAMYAFLLFKLFRQRKGPAIVCVLLAIPYLAASLFFVERNHGLFAFFLRPESKVIENNYVYVYPEGVSFGPERHNLILVLLESMEETFNNKAVFGKQLMPDLAKLRSKNTSFYGFDHFLGTSWTVAGITSYFFGIPLKLPIDGNSYDNKAFSAFLPGAPTILEVLEKNSYKIDIFLGSRATFSGKDNLFKTHTQNTTIHDLHYFNANHKDIKEADRIDWGLRDAYTYARAKEFLAATYNRPFEGNFMVIVETVDSHSPNDYYIAPGRPQVYGDYRDAIVETNRMAADFVAWARRQPFARNTTIILMGDHDVMATELGDVELPKYSEREIYNVFINPVPSLGLNMQQRKFGSFDMAPTILESLGVELPDGRFGIGVSLFRESPPTLYEIMGFDKLYEELEKPSSFYDKFYRPRLK